MHFPRSLGFGVAFLPRDYVTLALDYTTTNWAAGTRTAPPTQTVYTYNYTYSYAPARQVTTSAGVPGPAVTDQWPVYASKSLPTGPNNPPQGDTQQLRFGVEYVIRAPKMLSLSVLPIRAGVFTDRQFYKEYPNFGNINLLGLTAGFGLVWRHLSLDVAWVHQRGQYNAIDRDYTQTNVAGIYTYEYHFVYTAERDNQHRANKIYVSSIVRF
jgi:hypothetical protein